MLPLPNFYTEFEPLVDKPKLRAKFGLWIITPVDEYALVNSMIQEVCIIILSLKSEVTVNLS
ncbi:hypothetical protein NUACC21_75490 [Scytonema sp. NUACC21]